MCGIAAYFSRGKPVADTSLQRATAVLRHRGPDNQRHWLSRDRRIGLGHACLSIIDLSGGDQPIASEDEQLHIVVNGEFYDFERIRRELEGRGHRFRTKSDSEIALHLYEDFGAHGLTHLRGEFAFALWDANNQTLFAARDRFGIKPLFYGIAKYLLSRGVRDAGYRVVYTGEGSDEILGGYAHFRRDMLLHNAEGQDPTEVKRLLADLEAANPVSRFAPARWRSASAGQRAPHARLCAHVVRDWRDDGR